MTNGGGLLRYDGKDWTLIDSTLRTLTAASCDEGTLYAVGPVGAMLIVDDRLRQITSFDVTLADLFGVAAMPEGAMTVGSEGTVMFLSGGSWQDAHAGSKRTCTASSHSVPSRRGSLGRQGASYRLEVAGWRPVPTGVTVALRAVAGTGPQSAVAAGDDGTLLGFDGTWKPIETGVTTNLRAIARFGGMTWIVGDGGTVLTLGAPGGAGPAHAGPHTDLEGRPRHDMRSAQRVRERTGRVDRRRDRCARRCVAHSRRQSRREVGRLLTRPMRGGSAKMYAAEDSGRIAALLSLAAGYAGPPFTQRAPFGPAGRRRSLEERRDCARWLAQR